MRARRARLQDAVAIKRIVDQFTEDNTLLQRSFAELCENIRDFVIVEDGPEIIACGALHLYGSHLTEIRTIAVDPKCQGRGAGDLLINALLEAADCHGIAYVSLFTRILRVFPRLA